MDDLISRWKAIDRINKQREHLQPDIYPQDKIGDTAYRICAEFIARLPSAQPEPKWIPCSERLPETYGAYLVQDVWGYIFVDHWRGGWLAKTTMVAWRELPEPYKGGATE